MINIQTKSYGLISTLTLLAANALTVYFFIQGGSSVIQVLWTYWLQNIVIGAVNVIRLLSLPNSFSLSTEDVHVSTGAPTGLILKLLGAFFFMFHYGMFHFVYFIFLVSFSTSGHQIFNGQDVGPIDLGEFSTRSIAISGAIFAIHHLLSFISEYYQRRVTAPKIINVSAIMGRPYARVFPLHLIIIMSVPITLYYGQIWVFVAFMGLKTVGDLYLHLKGTSHVGTEQS